MIDGWFYYDYEQCFRRIGEYAKSIGCDVIYYENSETCSHPHSCKFLFNGNCICRIYYNDSDSDIFEQYRLEMLPDQYVPYNWFERLGTKFMNLFKKKKNYVMYHVWPKKPDRLIPSHYRYSDESLKQLTNNGYYVSEDQLKDLLKFYTTTNLMNYKKYQNALKINELTKDFE
jgi:hypothetical protein